MSFKALPVEQRPYKRYASISPSDTIVYDPPADAFILPSIIGATTQLGFFLTGSDDVTIGVSFDSRQSSAIIPLSIKKFPTGNSGSLTILWFE